MKNFYVENPADWKRNLSQKKFSDRKIGVKVIQRGMVLPARQKEGLFWEGGVCDNDFNFVAGFTRLDPVLKRRGERFGSVASSYTVEREEIFQLNEVAARLSGTSGISRLSV